MKKSLVALAALAAVGAASAQSSVTLYGVVDVNAAYNNTNAASLTSMGSGGLNGSRWGVRGVEDLGGGLKGIFRLESGFDTSNGTMGQGGRLFGRHATVGLEGGFGSVRLGRTLTPIGVLGDESATLGSKGMDLLSVAGMRAVTTFYRTDNAITFDSANFGGLTFSAQYTLGLGQTTAAADQERTDRANRGYGFNAIYKGGPFQAGLGFMNYDPVVPVVGGPAGATTRGADERSILANLGFNFGVAAVKGVFSRDDINTAEDPTFLGLEASVPLGAFTFSAGVGRVNNYNGTDGADAKLATLQGVYNLSKRTALYTFYTHVDNDGSARAGFSGSRVTAPATGAGAVAANAFTPAGGGRARAVQIGVRHSF